MAEIRGVAVNPIGQSQFTDHLAPFAVAMDSPLLFHEESEEALALSLYPNLKTLLVPFQDFSPEYLIANFEVTFLSDLWDRKTFRAKFAPLEKKYNKILRNVYCPHGFSDKGFYLRGCAFEDISLIYGQNMLDLLKEWGVLKELNQYVISGNYRLTYYLRHQEFFDKIVKESVLSHFKHDRKILIYAPTCVDIENSSSFFSAGEQLLKNLPEGYNLIVKLHPRLEFDDPAQFYHILSRYEDRGNILFLKDFPLIYPLLAVSDIYIGDMSSIGYDFLYFNRPMFFLNEQKRDPHADRGLYLFRCGTEIIPDEYPKFYPLLEKALEKDAEKYGALRSEVYEYTFGKMRAFDEIRDDVFRAVQNS